MTQDKKHAAKAARELLLSDRLPVIEDLAEAHAKLDTLKQRENEARAARTTAEHEVRTAYAAAQAKGWTAQELSQLGYSAPRKRSGGSSSRANTSNGNGEHTTHAQPAPTAVQADTASTSAGSATDTAGGSDE